MRGYREDLAYIHDAGFRDFALRSAPGLIRMLRQHGIPDGLVVDLGCGSGRWAAELNRAGYEALGIDQSASMIRMARRIAPRSDFRRASLLNARLPPCDAITSIGECLNYCFDPGNNRAATLRLFERCHQALRPGGIFVFDVAEPDRAPDPSPVRDWKEGPDWAVLVTAEGSRARRVLRRHIVSFRKIGRTYRRSEETHELRLLPVAELIADLSRIGFRASGLRGYGRFRFPPGIAGVLAIKP